MGSGSSRGGGSGAGGSGAGRSGGGGGSSSSVSSRSRLFSGSSWGRGLATIFKQVGLVSNVVGRNEVRNNIQDILKRIHRGNFEYFVRQFHGPMIRKIYESLFELSSCLRGETPKNRRTRLMALGLIDANGTLRDWATKLSNELKTVESDQRIWETGRTALEDLVTRIVRDDPSIYLNGNISQVLNNVDEAILSKLSNNILSSLIWNVIVREKERPRGSVESQIIQECDSLAVKIVDAFSEKFGTRYSEFLNVIAMERDWFFHVLTHNEK